jgi:YggT family protein
MIAVIQTIFALFNLLILARVLLSWVQLDPRNPIVEFIYNATEPILAPIRRVIPSMGMMDLSPLVALIGATIIESLIVQILVQTAR